MSHYYVDWICKYPGEREVPIIDTFDSYNSLLALRRKDVTSLSDSFTRQTAANGLIVLVSPKTKKLQSLLYGVQNFYRISMTPAFVGLDAVIFITALLTTCRREEVRELMTLTSETRSKEASPGALVSELKWIEWKPKFENYLSIITGLTVYLCHTSSVRLT